MPGQNYKIMEQSAREIFLRADQQQIIDVWELEADGDYIFLDYFSQKVRLDRRTAELSLAENTGAAGSGQAENTGTAEEEQTEYTGAAGAEQTFPLGDTVNDSLVIFDILTRGRAYRSEKSGGIVRQRPVAAGRWASISELGGILGIGHDQKLRHDSAAARFSGQTERLVRACRALGGVPCGKADVGFAIPVFRDLGISFQFWDADEEFPASIKYLFDANSLEFMHYEALWYMMHGLYSRLAWWFDRL